MKKENNRREYPLFSACGLNCGLCPRYHTDGTSRCPGCGGEGFSEKRPPCGILSCNRRHGKIESCCLCDEYPCKKYDGADEFDSFITHRNQLKDLAKAKEIGLDAYRVELDEKVGILQVLLDRYNDGRRKSFFCMAVNLLELRDVGEVMAWIAGEIPPDAAVKEASKQAAQLFQAMAERRDIALKLNQKKGSGKKSAGEKS